MPPIIRRKATAVPPSSSQEKVAQHQGQDARVDGGQECLAVNLADLDRMDPALRGPLLHGKLDLKAGHIRVDPRRVDEFAVGFTCDLLTAATLCDVVRSNDRKLRQSPTRVYLRRRVSWEQLPKDAVLTEVYETDEVDAFGNPRRTVRLNWDVFRSQVEVVQSVATETKTVAVAKAKRVVELRRTEAPERDVQADVAEAEEGAGSVIDWGKLSASVVARRGGPSLPLVSWGQHVERWRDCTACELHETRKRVVLGRGEVPCEVLFVGEAPGESEDVTGLPFIGLAGKRLDWIVGQGLPQGTITAFTNLVCCVPRDTSESSKGGKAAQPPHETIMACQERLEEVIRIADGEQKMLRLIVAVGGLSEDYLVNASRWRLQTHRQVDMIHIVHPAAILRANLAQQDMMERRAIAQLRSAAVRLLVPPY